MKKTLIFFVVMGLVVFSSLAFANNTVDEAEIDWGPHNNAGMWGFTYKGEYNDDGDYVGSMDTYWNIQNRWHNRINKTVRGAYIDDGQSLTTTIGFDLDALYSPYVAYFSRRILGIRVSGYELAGFNFDGVYVMGQMAGGDAGGGNTKDPVTDQIWGGITPSDQEFAINARGSLFDMVNLNITTLRHRDNEDNNIFNLAIEADMVVMDGLNIDSVYANYQDPTKTDNTWLPGEDTDNNWLYEVNLNYDVLPGLLSVRAGHRDSHMPNNLNASHITNNKYWIRDHNPDLEASWSNRGEYTRGTKPDDYAYDYVIYERDKFYNVMPWDFRNSIDKIVDRGESYNVGATVNYEIPGIENILHVDFEGRLDDGRDNLEAILLTEAFDFMMYQKPLVLFADDNNAETSFYYGLGLMTPSYDISLPMINDISLTGKFNFDFDVNFDPDPNMYTITGLQMSTNQDIWRLSNVQLDGIMMADLADFDFDNNDNDLIKFILMAAYTAPNRIQFRLQYFSSDDYADSPVDESGRERYSPYRFYDDDTLSGGLRMSMAIPF